MRHQLAIAALALIATTTAARAEIAARVKVAPGDTLVLYTDGVSDLAPPHDLVETEVLDLVAESAGRASDAEGTADNIHQALAEILPLDRREDDIALLVLRARPT